MTHTLRIIVATATLWSSALVAQGTSYEPASDFPNGRQVIAVYVGAKWCAPCMRPAIKHAVRQMKPLLRAEAARRGATFTAIVVALDRRLEDALSFTKDLGAFDEYAFGGDLAGLASERLIWGDADPLPAVPQIIIAERTIAVERGKPILFGAWKRIHRVSGDSIPVWVNSGATLP